MVKPTVLYVGPLPPHPGGSASVSGQVVGGLSRLGHEIVAISTLSSEHRRHDSSLIDSGVTIHAVAVEQYRNSSWATERSQMEDECRRIIELGGRVASASRPDVVLLGRADYKDPGLGLASMLGIPLVVIDHGAASAHLNGFSGVTETYRLGRLCEEADCIVCVADYRAETLRANGIGNVTAIPNAIDHSHFRPGSPSGELVNALSLPPHARLIAHVSNMKPLKRIGDYLAAVARIGESEANVHALVVGDGLKCTEHEAEAQSLGLEGRVTFTGWLDRERMALLYRSVEMIVQPSEIEGAPLVALEAMASACPVVASDILAHRELLQHDRTGVLVPTGDVETLAGSILGLLHAHGRRREIAVAAEAASRPRTIEKMIARYSETLSMVASSAIACPAG